MPFKLSVDNPHLGETDEIQITGLGTFRNGKSYKVTDELAENFRVANGHVDLTDAGPKRVLGASLDEVEIFGVTIEELPAEPKQDEQDENNEGSEG